MAYVVSADGMPGWSAGVREYLHSGVYVQPVGSGPARPVLPVGLTGPIDPLIVLLSPDGSRLAVEGQPIDARNHTASSAFVIWVMSLDGSGGHVVATFPNSSETTGPYIGDFTWTPDGRSIVFSVVTESQDLKSEAFSLWQAFVDGAPQMARIPGTAGLDMPTYDPITGALVAVKTESVDGERRRSGLVMRREGRDPVLLPQTYGATDPVMSPDGSQLAYLTRDDSGDVTSTLVTVAQADGTEPVAVTIRGNVDRLAFGSDGNLYFDESNQLGPSALYSVPARPFSSPTRLTTVGKSASSPSVAPVRSGVTTSRPRPVPTSSPTSSAVGDLRKVDFGNIAAPAAACFAARPIQMYDGLAYTPNRDGNPGNPITFDPTDRPYYQLALTVPPVYGRLRGGVDVAAVALLCNNNGGTAAGQLLFSVAVYSASSGHLRLLGLITPRVQNPDRHVTLLGDPVIRGSAIAVEESWYGDDDPDCCPTGRAVSTWVYQGGRLVPQGTSVVARPHPPTR